MKTKPAHPDDYWRDSPEYKMAQIEWYHSMSAVHGIKFEDSIFYVDARTDYRKRTNTKELL